MKDYLKFKHGHGLVKLVILIIVLILILFVLRIDPELWLEPGYWEENFNLWRKEVSYFLAQGQVWFQEHVLGLILRWYDIVRSRIAEYLF